MMIGLVRVQLSRPASRPATLAVDRWDRIEHLREGHAVMHIGPGQGERERDAVTVRDEMAFGAGTATIGRIRPSRAPPILPRWRNYPARPGSSRCGWRLAGGAATRGATAPIHPPPASRVGAASRLPQSRIPSREAASPRESRCAARRECPSARRAPGSAAGRTLAAGAAEGARARGSTRGCRRLGARECVFMNRIESRYNRL